jgi:hypothetical protein
MLFNDVMRPFPSGRILSGVMERLVICCELKGLRMGVVVAT